MKQYGSTNPLILGLIVLLGFASGYFLYSQGSGEVQELPLPALIADPSYPKFKDVHFNFSLFTDKQFQSLKIFGEYPLQAGATGKQDLFAP